MGFLFFIAFGLLLGIGLFAITSVGLKWVLFIVGLALIVLGLIVKDEDIRNACVGCGFQLLLLLGVLFIAYWTLNDIAPDFVRSFERTFLRH